MLLMSVAGIVHFALLGWYGSRCATVWALFWMAGIIHYRFRKLPAKMMAVRPDFFNHVHVLLRLLQRTKTRQSRSSALARHVVRARRLLARSQISVVR